MLEIAHGHQRAVIAELGATLRSWSVDDRELLDGHGPDADYRGRVLAPWPNRLRDGRYEFAGAVHQVAVNEPARGCALHGFVAGLGWDVEDRSGDRVALTLLLEPRVGYPFGLRLAVEYALDESGLVVTLTATNVGDGDAPFGAGFHPYLRCERLGDARLHVPGEAIVPIDAERLLPTGPPVPVAGSDIDFRSDRPISGTAINACYTDIARDAAGIARARLAGEDASVELWMDAAFGFATVYTADQVADPGRRRRSVAIEPMTCAPDAFNTGLGLRVLESGGALSGSWGMTRTA